jgi:hypothetical protein
MQDGRSEASRRDRHALRFDHHLERLRFNRSAAFDAEGRVDGALRTFRRSELAPRQQSGA